MKRNHVLTSALVLGLILVLLAGLSAQLPQGAAHAQDPDQEAPASGSAAPQALGGSAALAPLGTAFTYQGRLKDGGSLAGGQYDFYFGLHDHATVDSLVASPVTIANYNVVEGLFTVQLDFGDVFTGTARYLEIGVRPGASSGPYTRLSPRQELTPAPYALALPGLWTQQNPTSPNLIGGYDGNWVAGGIVGATIGGGGELGFPNRVTADMGTVAGGVNNAAQDSFASVGGGDDNQANAVYTVVAGGYLNRANGQNATVGGGLSNTAALSYTTVSGGRNNTARAEDATIGGGENNDIWAGSDHATIAGGGGNDIGVDSSLAFVGGGVGNTIGENSDYATIGGGFRSGIGNHSGGTTIAGGENNDIGNGSIRSTIGGGYINLIGNGSDYATIPGGRQNEANADYAFAAGRRAKAGQQGAFVWADSSNFDFASVVADSFNVRATGGVTLVTGINGSGAPNAGAVLLPGSSSWSVLSDRGRKANVAPVDGQALLARLAQVPITTWSYRAQDPSIRHIGPMAQDFYAAFGLGESQRYISTVDADGVALAAIQALYAQNQDLTAEVSTYRAENAALREKVDSMETRLAALERGGISRSPALGLPSWLLLGGLVLAGGVVLRQRRTGGGK
jgi:hypothetical protein